MNADERRHFRDRFRQARYAALANAEGFSEICFAIEELGIRLADQRLSMGGYQVLIDGETKYRPESHLDHPDFFSTFTSLYGIVTAARNDAMHTGAYARRATAKALELCLLIEDGLMTGKKTPRLVGDYMVRDAIFVEVWTPIAKVRQLMLLHSFSNVPVNHGGTWKLLTELEIALFLQRERGKRLALSVEDAEMKGLKLTDAATTKSDADADKVIQRESGTGNLWLVLDKEERLVGVLSPFELM